MSKITVLYSPARITIFHSLYPLIVSDQKREFKFVRNHDFCLKNDTNKILFIFRYLKDGLHKQNDLQFLNKLRQKYEKIIFFDDSDGADSFHFNYMPYVDLYYKKQVLVKEKHYFRRLYGRQFFSDYYHKKFNVLDQDSEKYREPLEEKKHLKKIRLFWNLGIGSYPISRWQIRTGRFIIERFFSPKYLRFVYSKPLEKTQEKPKTIQKIQARFGARYQNESIAFQRKLFLKKAETHQHLFLTGRISKQKYDEEIENVAGVLSPFGWGEICFRDFESISKKSVLLKPDMGHLKTWPDVYQNDLTYVPVAWDGSDLKEKAGELLQNETKRREIADNAFQVYSDAFGVLDTKVEKILNCIYSQ